ncbi:MAG: hypothetical protein ACLQLG_09180 [Thermoguttaceae bacterium]
MAVRKPSVVDWMGPHRHGFDVIPLLPRLGLVGGAWAVALVVTDILVAAVGGASNPLKPLGLAVLFPNGLTYWLCLALGHIMDKISDSLFLYFWAFYAGLTIFLLACYRRRLFWIVYAALAAVLALNVSGCGMIAPDLRWR